VEARTGRLAKRQSLAHAIRTILRLDPFFEIENTPRGDFQIKGVSHELQSRFSKRHNQIDASIEKLLKEKPELANGNLKELRSQIAQNERSRKIEGIALPELQRLWNSQLTENERQSLRKLLKPPKTAVQIPIMTPQAAIEWAEAHLFDRRSVVRESEVWSAALEHSRGQDWSLQAVKSVTDARGYVRNENLPSKITTREILSCEWEIVCHARDGRGQFPELSPQYQAAPGLMPDQAKAAEHILGSCDFVTLFCGGAGTGKSHTLREIGNGLKAAGHISYVIAPQRQQALDLEKSFTETQTVSEFLARREMMPGAVVKRLEFIAEQPPDKTPDFVVSIQGVDSFIECKKAARIKAHSKNVRDAVGALLNGVIAEFRERRISALVEVVFNCDPLTVANAVLFEASLAALEEHTLIVTPQFTVKTVHLPKYASTDYVLHPSPGFSWNRYRYRTRGEWFGLVHQVVGVPRRTLLPKHLRGGVSTWLDAIDWDTAIKWKIGEQDIVAKYRRFAFDGLFHAMDQIDGKGLNSTVHLWLESDFYLGGRRDAMLDFFKRLKLNHRPAVGWIVINETLFEVSPKGHPDLIEHAHMISGPTATKSQPLVSGVFGEEESTQPVGEFGVGRQLEDIDAE
jgi:hypothetical protein